MLERRDDAPPPVYTLTPRALEALREWAPTPVRFPRVEHQALVRLLAAGPERRDG